MIPTLSNTDGYNLLVYCSSGNLYCINIMDNIGQFHNFEGIYPDLQAAVARGKAVIANLKAVSRKISNHN